MSFLNGKKTYLGIIVAALPTVAGLFGYNVTVEGATELTGILGTLLENVEGLIQTGGLLLAWYGRKVTKGA